MVALCERRTCRPVSPQKILFSMYLQLKMEIAPQIWLKYRKMSKIFHDSFQMETFGDYVQTTFETKDHAGKEFVHMRLHFLF